MSPRASQPSRCGPRGVNGTSAAPRASHVRRTRGTAANTSRRERRAPDSIRVTVSSWRTIRDRRSACSVMMSRRRSGRSGGELLGVAADAREGRLEVVRHAAQEVVLGRVEVDEAAVLGLHARIELGVADRPPPPRSRTARAGPGRRAPSDGSPAGGRRGCPAPRPVATRRARTGTASPGTVSSSLDGRPDRRGGPRSRSCRTPRGPRSPARRAMPTGGSSRRIDSSASSRWRSSRFRRAMSRASRLWLSARRLISSSPGSSRPAGSSPAETRSTDRASARSQRPRLAVSAAASSTPMTIGRRHGQQQRRGRAWRSRPSPAPATRIASAPKPRTGRTAAAISPTISRARKPTPGTREPDRPARDPDRCRSRVRAARPPRPAGSRCRGP